MGDFPMSQPTTATLARLRSTFRSGVTLNVEWRVQQLEALKKMVFENQDAFIQAVREDLRKPEFETVVMELSMFFDDVELALNKIHDWVKPRSVSKPNLVLWGMDSLQMLPEPFGLLLMIVPWNYPFQLSLVPLVGVIAAGNCCVIKPSELAPQSEKLLAELIPRYLDNSAFAVVTGGVPETTELLKEKFDHILYTGSTAVGKIVMQAAAKHLTPVTLELGGKSPCIVDESADLYVAARRITWGKLVNAGQSCIAPDYVLIHESVESKFIEQLEKVTQEMLGDNPQQSKSYARIINERHFDRISSFLEEGTIAFGGQTDRSDLYIAPTVIRNVTVESAVMKEEIFGPVLPIMTYSKIEDAIEQINDNEKPLALYIFSRKNQNISLVEKRTSSGAFTVNDTMTHAGCNTLPFGGVGPSGIGAYHGAHSFEAFSHMKPCLRKFPGLEMFNDVRVAPYDSRKLSMIRWVVGYPKSLARSGSLFRFMKIFGLGVVVTALIAWFTYRYNPSS